MKGTEQLLAAAEQAGRTAPYREDPPPGARPSDVTRNHVTGRNVLDSRNE
ncbi:hypothetical protein GCM10015535_28290 [Streptomyces gelaticus]|uniref:Uncharacterized protein n=1 Tax=Streptomyces gelaticus TaxID=285446 RepID=A0ABQ2VXV7_9ACTN|nr:hypothetical protein GCM10015535_28290 [Streptomyces gelaticus]